VQMLVLDTRGADQDRRDRRLLKKLEQRGTLSPTLQYSHRGSKDELLLSLPDAFAWCWGAGGTWRNRIRPLIGSVIRP
jgi:hypothetical protein